MRNIPSIALRDVKMMANSIDSSIGWKVTSANAITSVTAEIASIASFSTDFSDDTIVDSGNAEVRPQVVVPLVSSLGSVVKNASVFTDDSATVGAAAVTLSRYSRPFVLAPADRGNGLKMASLIAAAARTVAKGIAADIVLAAYRAGAPTITLTTTTISASDVTTKVFPGIAGNVDALVLDKTNYGKLLPTDANGLNLGQGAFGVSSISYMEGTTDATNKFIGFAANARGLAVASRLPYLDSVEYPVQEIIDMPELGGLKMAYYEWFDKATQKRYGCVDVWFGCAVGDTNAIKPIKTA